MKWTEKFKNKAFVVTFCTAILAFLYNIAGLLGVMPPISEDVATQGILSLVNLVFGFGIALNPNTPGVGD